MKTTFMFPLLGLFVEKQMRRFRAITPASSPSFTTLPAKKSSAAWHMRRWSCTYGRGKRGKKLDDKI